MARKNPHIEEASYQHPAYYDRSAVRLVVYLFRRPNDKNNATKYSSWTTVPKERRLGDARSFIREADHRTRELWQDAKQRSKRSSLKTRHAGVPPSRTLCSHPPTATGFRTRTLSGWPVSG